MPHVDQDHPRQAGSDPRAAERLAVALSLAEIFDAHLTVLFPIPSPIIPTGYVDYIPASVIEQEVARSRDLVAAAKTKALETARLAGRNVEWREEQGPQITTMTGQAHYADLIVLDQKDPLDDGLPGTMVLAAHVALSAGRPVLCVPYVGASAKPIRKVMIAWNATREATRAAHDMLPLLKRAEQVIIFSINPDADSHYPGADIPTHLVRHGVKVETRHTIARDIDVADALLGAVSDFGIDLLVMGAYGHTRLRELVFGGATRTVLETMTVPVLLSH